MNMEKWIDVRGYEGFYKVSNFGRVKSFCKKKPRILKPKVKENGYLSLVLLKRKHFYVHRIVADNFIKPIPKNLYVNHIDGDKTNNKSDNLEIVTMAENNLHAFRMGLKKPLILNGSDNGNSKLKDEDVIEIRKLFRDGLSGVLAKQFNVNPSTILRVVKRGWKHI